MTSREPFARQSQSTSLPRGRSASLRAARNSEPADRHRPERTATNAGPDGDGATASNDHRMNARRRRLRQPQRTPTAVPPPSQREREARGEHAVRTIRTMRPNAGRPHRRSNRPSGSRSASIISCPARSPLRGMAFGSHSASISLHEPQIHGNASRRAGRISFGLPADSRSAVQRPVGANGTRMQGDETGLDHRGWVEVLQPADVGRHQLRRVGCEYVHHGGDQVGGDVLAAQQQVGHSDRTDARVARSRRSALGGRRTGSRRAGSSVPPARRCRASAAAVWRPARRWPVSVRRPTTPVRPRCRPRAGPVRPSGGTSACPLDREGRPPRTAPRWSPQRPIRAGRWRPAGPRRSESCCTAAESRTITCR